jgi:hypothetical protein
MSLVTFVAVSLSAVSLSLPLQATAVKLQVGDKKSSTDSAAIAKRKARVDTVAARMDSIRAVRDSIAVKRRLEKKIPLTPQLLANAFRDSTARELLNRARVTRLTQDSSLISYDATTYERLSVELQIGRFGRERPLLRSERATRVRWERTKGALVDVTGARAAIPTAGRSGNVDVEVNSDVPIPYFPGSDALWIGSGLAKANVTDSDIINPLAHGAEAYYTYATGDSLSFQLRGGSRIIVRELLVRPRTPRWNVVVGSLWFDVSSGQLVRAVYRLSEPIDILATAKEYGENDMDDIPFWIRPFLTPMSASLDVITVDYGLFEGRFWLPRLQIVEGKGNIGAFHASATIQQRFEYASVNGTLDIPLIQPSVADTARDPEGYRARREEKEERCKDQSATYDRQLSKYENTLNVLIRTPCDTAALTHSSTLPPSIYSATDTLFNESEIEAMIESALGLQHQGGFVPQRPVVRYGLRYTTYNRVEGVATGAEVEQTFGNGYTGRALLRFGTADLRPKGELSLSRSNGRQTLTVTGYARLVAANDWGNFFSLSSSLSALLLGRDEGMYYRTWGGELRYEQESGLIDSWRLFAEGHSDARVHSTFSVMHALRDSHRFRDNIDATNGSVFGLALRKRGALGQDPRRPRLASDFRVEGGVGSFDYVRGMLDLTLSSPITSRLDAALTLSGGTSGGELPVQRLWFLGGTYTVRGQPITAAVGNAYWLTRLELGGSGVPFFRPTLFGDLGWAGNRDQFTKNVRPISGAGIGFSILDGLIRFDVAKGIRPKRSVRGSLYLDARF